MRIRGVCLGLGGLNRILGPPCETSADGFHRHTLIRDSVPSSKIQLKVATQLTFSEHFYS
jgi:hypothetical protein